MAGPEYTPTTLQGGKGVGGDGQVNGNKNSLLFNENYLTYAKSFGDHDLSVMAGYSYQKARDEGWSGRSQSFPTDAGLYWNLGTGSVYQRPGSGLSEWELASWYSRVNYSFNSKYLITFNARYDGSSVFSEGKQWAFFPSGAIAWNMKDESFMSGSQCHQQLEMEGELWTHRKPGNWTVSDPGFTEGRKCFGNPEQCAC
jgi:hypothetical protein